MGVSLQGRSAVEKTVRSALWKQPVRDMHTHLYPPSFGTPVPNKSGKTDATGLMLWGIDETLTYHYLISEVFRVVPPTVLPYEQFWKMSKTEQADHIWKHLFVERPPVSEACRGVVTVLKKLGLEVGAKKDLPKIRRWFAQQDPSKYIDKVMELANVSSITMTNALFDDNERQRWLDNPAVGSDPRFKAVLRIDPVLVDFPAAARRMKSWGYDVSATLNARTVAEVRRCLGDWIERMKAIYVAVSLPPEWRYPAVATNKVAVAGQKALEEIVLAECRARNVPFAMMIGSRRAVNPLLRDAGDMGGLADVTSLVRLLAAFPENRFLVTMLARENQHELAVAARKFSNLMPFGCWWFLNNPSLIEEITRMRVELLGSSVIPQHSDARILDQLLYKWEHSREVIARVLTDKYADLVDGGWPLMATDVQDDVARMLEGNFSRFL